MINPWYRIDPNIGSKIATSLTKPLHCKTIASGWIQGLFKPDFGKNIESKVCFNIGNGCKYSRQIKIRNCGQYILYYLPEALQYSLNTIFTLINFSTYEAEKVSKNI